MSHCIAATTSPDANCVFADPMQVITGPSAEFPFAPRSEGSQSGNLVGISSHSYVLHYSADLSCMVRPFCKPEDERNRVVQQTVYTVHDQNRRQQCLAVSDQPVITIARYRRPAVQGSGSAEAITFLEMLLFTHRHMHREKL